MDKGRKAKVGIRLYMQPASGHAYEADRKSVV